MAYWPLAFAGFTVPARGHPAIWSAGRQRHLPESSAKDALHRHSVPAHGNAPATRILVKSDELHGSSLSSPGFARQGPTYVSAQAWMDIQLNVMVGEGNQAQRWYLSTKRPL